MHSVRQGSGEPLLLVHGLGSTHHTWDLVLPALAAEREVVAVDLPGFGETPPLSTEVTIAALTDAVEEFVDAEGLADVDIVGSSMGARIVLELARRGHRGTVVALDPGGFWTDGEVTFFNASIRASTALLRVLGPALPAITRSAAGRTALLAQFSAHPWRLPADLVLTELEGFIASASFDDALTSLVRGPRQAGAPAGTLSCRVVIGWGRQDRVTPPRQAHRAIELFPDATLHWFDSCGHFPTWDQPAQAASLTLDAIGHPA